ncbi:MAG: HEPN domain-containing protein [Chthonomonadales bacterium]
MERTLLRTVSAVDDCERHLKETNSAGTEIESYLTQYLLVVLCADVQEELYRICEERAKLANDEAMFTFISASSRKVLRSVLKHEIAGFVGMFGQNEKLTFNKIIDDETVTKYNNAVSNRHDVAHKTGTQVSFSELKEALVAAQDILQAVELALAKDPT